ncbi:hypothetical protein AALP_AAs54940U000100, partial [Arabis alpina]
TWTSSSKIGRGRDGVGNRGVKSQQFSFFVFREALEDFINLIIMFERLTEKRKLIEPSCKTLK